MAYATFREPNQVKWVGVLPGHNGEQVIAQAVADNSTVIAYTVPAGKILLLSHFTSCVFNNAGGIGTAYGYVRDNLGVEVFRMHTYRGADDTSVSIHGIVIVA